MKVTFSDVKSLVVITVAVAASLSTGQVMAQSSGGALEEVVVTAQKRAESLQQAALSITALQGDAITSFNARDINDLQSHMPGVQFMSSGLTNTTIRGVGTYNNQPNVDDAVAWTVDGTYLVHHQAVPPILFDIKRIEVARGPLGTLYGKNSNGGAINVITNAPELGKWDARVKLGYGNYNSINSEAMVNIPVTEDMAIRVSFANDHADSYFEDGSNSKDRYAGRVRLLVEPSDNFNLTGTVAWSNVDDGNTGLSFCPPLADVAHYPTCAGVKWKPYQGFGLPGQFFANGKTGPVGKNPGFTQRENWSAYLEWNYSWDAATLTSISDYHKYDRQELLVWDFFSYSPTHHDEFISQEFRLASAASARYQWVVGAFIAFENSDGVEKFGAQVAPDYQRFAMNNYYGVNNGRVDTRAVFGHVTIPIGDRFRINGGLRYTDERKDLPGEAGTGFLPGNGPPIIVQTGASLSEGKLTWSGGVEYDVTDHNMLYAKVNTGFKSGTVNQIPSTVTAVAAVSDPEEITAYQVGSKNDFLDGRLRANAEFFYYDYTGYQVVITASDPTGFFPGVFFPSVNSQKARYYGGEIETSYAIWDHGQLDVNLTLLSARHKKFITNSFDWSGHDVQRSPVYTIMAAYQHDWSLPNGGTLNGRISTMYVKGNYTQDSNNLPGYEKSYSKTDAYMTYEHPGSHWSLTAWVRNLENSAVVAVGQSSAGRAGGYNVFMYPPRMYGVSVEYKM